MKKLLKKFRLWLIDKLGGTYQVVKVVNKYEKPVLLQVKMSVSERELLLRDLGVEHYVKQKLSELLVQEMMDNNLVVIDHHRAYETSAIVFRARINVVKGGD